jgi:hypothetical protein
VPRRPTIIVVSILAVALVVFIVVFWSKGKAGSTEAFCTSVRSGDNPLDVLSRYDPTNVEGTRQQLDQGVERLRALEDAAPSEIHDDMKVLVDVARQLADALDPANKDKPPPDLTSQFDRVRAASANVTGFASANCGVDLAPTTTSG